MRILQCHVHRSWTAASLQGHNTPEARACRQRHPLADCFSADPLRLHAAALERYGPARIPREWDDFLARTGNEELELTG